MFLLRLPRSVLVQKVLHFSASSFNRFPGKAHNMYAAELKTAIAAAREAGDVLRKAFYRDGGPEGEGGHCPTDNVAEDLIRRALESAHPHAVLGEEHGFSGPSGGQRVWLVDPNDGTSAYLRQFRGSAVSIALLDSGVPVLGVVYAYCAPDDDGDMIAWAAGEPLTRNGVEIKNRKLCEQLGRNSVVMASQDADTKMDTLMKMLGPARFRAMPSIAYRLALTAVGEADAATSLAGAVSWDYAAGHALLRAVGGVVVGGDGVEMKYAADGRGAAARGICLAGHPDVARALSLKPWADIFTAQQDKGDSKYPFVKPIRGRVYHDKGGELNRAFGCILGQVSGDSLGSLVEFQSVARIKALYPQGVRLLEDGGTFNTMAGQPTDDSEMALMLARSIVNSGTYSAEAALRAYAHWCSSNPFDIGNTTRIALSAALSGIQQNMAGDKLLEHVLERASPMSQANGGLMRVSPLAIFGSHASDEQLIQWSRTDTRLTHPHEVCQAASAAFTVAIARGIRGADRAAMHAAALSAAKAQNAQEVVNALEKARDSAPADFMQNMGWVLLALQNAFYQLLHAASFEEGVVASVVAGGDTDTNGAIAGALLGAYFGGRAVPLQWRNSVLSCRTQNLDGFGHKRWREFWPIDVLQLAERLLVLGSSQQV